MHPLAADTDPMKKDLMTMHVVAAVQKRLFIQSPGMALFPNQQAHFIA